MLQPIGGAQTIQGVPKLRTRASGTAQGTTAELPLLASLAWNLLLCQVGFDEFQFYSSIILKLFIKNVTCIKIVTFELSILE